MTSDDDNEELRQPWRREASLHWSRLLLALAHDQVARRIIIMAQQQQQWQQ